jgi:hypothetical protein
MGTNQRRAEVSWQEELNAKRKAERWYGCIAPDGWQKIVEETDAMLLHMDPEYQILQVKEKYGTLRYYFGTNHASDTMEYKIMHAIERAAEYSSGFVCQICGTSGETRWKLPWVQTLCDEHYEPYEETE